MLRRNRAVRAVVGASGVALVVVVATSVLPRLSALALFTTPVEEVAVTDPSASELGEPQALGDRDPTQAQELRALVDPNRLRCAPAPCEVWRVPFDGGQPWQLRADGGRVGMLDGTDVVLLDAATGSELLRASLVVDGAVTGDGDPIAGPQQSSSATPIRDGVAVVVGDRVTVVDDDGTRRWDRAIAGAGMGFLQVVSGNLLLEAPAGRGGGSSLWLLDVDTGDTLFEGPGLSGPWNEPRDGVILAWDTATGVRQRAVAIDPGTGEVLWDRPLPAGGGVYPVELGDLLLLRREPAFWYGDEGIEAHEDVDADDGDGRGDGHLLREIELMAPSELLDLRTGEVVHTFDDPVVGAAGRGDRAVVATARAVDAARLWGHGPADEVAPEVRLLLLDQSGTVRTERILQAPTLHGCCFDLWDDGATVIVQTREGSSRLTPDGELEPVPPGEDRAWTDPSTGLIHEWQAAGTTLRTPDGASVQLTSGDVWILGRADDVVIVAAEREVVGVRLVPAAP